MPKSIIFILSILIFLQGCYVSVEREAWKKHPQGIGLTSKNKPLSLIRKGAGFQFVGCSGHNPVIRICVRPRRYYVDFVSEGVTLRSALIPDGYRIAASIDENSFLLVSRNFEQKVICEVNIKTKETKVLSSISYTYNATTAAEKQDMAFSIRGKYVAWAEPTGLGIINLRTGEEKKHLKGLPVRAPKFSSDESVIEFNVWLDTSAIQKNTYNIDYTTLRQFNIPQRIYDGETHRYIETGTTTEYVGRVYVDIETSNIIKTDSDKDGACRHSYNGECKDSFEPYRYRQSPFW